MQESAYFRRNTVTVSVLVPPVQDKVYPHYREKMSHGMWTKQFTAEGIAYFYNSSLNQSVWQPPDDGVVHIAPYLGYQFEPTPVQEGNFDRSYRIVENSTYIDLNSNADINNDEVKKESNSTISSIKVTSQEDMKKRSLAKRFNSDTSSNDERSINNGNESSYLRQKAELEAMMGCKKDDTAKWLVR